MKSSLLVLSFGIAVATAIAQAVGIAPAADPRQAAPVYRLYDGITAYVNNPDGIAFNITLDLRDINVFASGPREVLFKIYDPDGQPVLREVIPDDGVASRAYLPRIGGWDHEMWYYALCYTRGFEPMIRWSAFSDPARLAAQPKRTFVRSIKGGKKGIYRIMLVGERDHYITLTLTPLLNYAVSGHALWLHGHGDLFKKSYIYVPKGTTGLHLGFVEYDPPQTRRFTLTAPGGKTLFDGVATGGFTQATVNFDQPGQFDNKRLTLEVSDGPGDYMLHILLNNVQLGKAGSAAILAPDKETADAVRGGAIYHDGQVFWHMFQIRLHDYLNTLKPDDFVVKDEQGEVVGLVKVQQYSNGWDLDLDGLPKREGFLPLNGPHVAPPLSDRIMHNYPAHKNRQALNLAIRDLADGLRSIATGDHRAVPGWNGNLAYIFGTYEWHYWRPAWRILQQSDAPQEVKDIIREAFILCGDRLAFARGIERVNGNACSHIPEALRYCCEATGDPLQKKLFETYFNRFVSEGWGEGTGISKSGDCQEHFAHEHHYGSYIFDNWGAVVADFGDQRFKSVVDRIKELYSYTWCREAYANPWSARTAHSLSEEKLRSSGIPWKGEPGPDFTVSVNGGDEWFGARRKNYYILTFHGRLAPMWLNNFFGTRVGYGGGAICQLTVPGKGTVIASTLNGDYGSGMEPWNWRNFHIHALVGELYDGGPLVTADSEHPDARLIGNVVTSSGEVRDCPVHVTRKYTFGRSEILCEVQLADTNYRNMLWNRGRRSDLKEAYEMLPFLPAKAIVVGADGQEVGDLTGEPKEGKAVVIDRGGYGVRVELEKPASVLLGANKTLLIQALDKPGPAAGLVLKYRLVPFTAP